MYLKFDGTQIAISGVNNGVNLWASAAGQTLQGGSLNDVLGGVSGDTLIGGLGDNQYYLNGWSTIVQGPTGINTVTTWMDYSLPDNIENLNVSGAGLYAAGNSLDNLIAVGDDNGMQLYGAGGNNVLVGGAGGDTFIIDQTAGSDAIYGWHSGDIIRLEGGPLQSFAQVQAAMTQQGSDVVVQNGAHPFVIRNATIAQFQASDFYLPLDHSKLGGLTFDDEFSSLSLHTAANPSGTWTPNYWYGGIGAYTLPGNGELQLYTAPGFTGQGTADLGLNPFSVANGVLDIHAQTVTPAQSAAMWNYNYSSGVITTHDSFAQTYGYFEMRAELPTDVAGAWPAFWLVPADGSWPPELDVMETLSGSPNIDYTTQHSASGGYNWSVGSANLVTNAGGFHTYGVLWTAATLTWYLDGQEVFQTATPADMNKPMYMIANMAIGGWAGTPNFASTDMYIDYIRAYALADGSSSVTSSVTPQTPSATLAADIPSSSVLLSGTAPPSGGGGTTSPPVDTTSGQAVTVSDASYTAPEGVTSITLTGTNQTVTGNNDGDTFISNNSGNALIGGTGADTFYMGRGGDWAAGGGGDNTYVFGSTPWSVDHITDFTPGQDTIDLTGLLAASGYTGTNPIADGYIKIVDDPAGAQVWTNLSGTWWEVVILSGVSASSLQLQNGMVSGVGGQTPPATPSTPGGLALASIVGGYVNQAHDTAGQTLTGAAPAGTTVTVYNGSQALGAPVTADANGNWSVTIGALADGTYSLTAVATGAGGTASAASAPLTFVVDTQAPAAPSGLTDGAVANGYVNQANDTAGQTLTGAAEAGSLVAVSDGSIVLGTATANASGQWSFVLGHLADGSHAIAATATDAAGNASAASAPLTFVVDTQAPAAPAGLADGAIVKGYVGKAANTSSETLTGTAEAGALVTVFDGAAALGTAAADSTGRWSFVVGALADGSHSLTASATDAAGNTGAASPALNFIVDTFTPTPTVSDVVIGSSYAVISGQTEAGSAVSILDNGKAIGSATANASGAWSFNASLSGSGIHSLTETAMDAAGNAGSSPGVTLYSTRSGQSLTGGAGADVLIGRSGDTLTGGAGADHFVFNASFGKEAINDFTPGTDQVWIASSVVADFTHLLADAKQSGTDVVITVDRSDVLTLHHVTLGALHATDFLFF
jgi:beta-glucanase (GH16 family)